MGLPEAGIAVLATMELVKLCIYLKYVRGYEWTGASLQSFVGSNISHTLESFSLTAYDNTTTAIDDVQVATALASCHNLTTLDVHLGDDGCVFGSNGFDGLQAMATGCPLLEDVSFLLTVPGLHYVGTHFTNLKKCFVYNTSVAGAPTPEGFPSIEELQTLYPAVKWEYANPDVLEE
jgi:hypothetical protein